MFKHFLVFFFLRLSSRSLSVFSAFPLAVFGIHDEENGLANRDRCNKALVKNLSLPLMLQWLLLLLLL